MTPCKVFYRFSAHYKARSGPRWDFSTLELFEAIGWENLDGEDVNPLRDLITLVMPKSVALADIP